MSRISKLIIRIKVWFEQLASSRQTPVYRYLNELNAFRKKGQTVILVQCVEDLCYFGLFGQITSSLREKQPVRVDQYVLRSLNVGESNSCIAYIYARFIENLFQNFIWTRVYSVFCDGVAYQSTSFRPVGDVIDLYRAWKCRQGLTDKNSLTSIQIDFIPVGDLINDSYLRFKPAPTVDLKDAYLLVLLWQAHRDVRRARTYFSHVNPKIYLTSYSTYIQHGVPVRVALHYGVRVFSFGNYQEFAKTLTLKDWQHTKNPDGYASEFKKLDCKDEKLALAEAALLARLSGGVDAATAYMTKSAYAKSSDPVPNVLGAVVIFLHDFYDSPHVYREMLFPDFWEWVCFTINTLKSKNIPFFIKPHPNQIDLSDTVLGELKRCYPELLMISSGVTNKQLVEAGISCAVTVYGTVAHEMAYLGVPTIACGHHPHISFDFCRTAYSLNEYTNLLKTYTQTKVDKDTMRRQSLMFYYMHNLAIPSEMQELRTSLSKFRVACETTENDVDMAVMLREMSECAGYKVQISEMMQ